MKNDELLRILDVKESFEVPNKLLQLLLSENSENTLEMISNIYDDLHVDEFNNYYQTYLSERGDLKQDYTPNEVGKLLNYLVGSNDVICDICAGSGTLTINYWNDHPNVYVHCEEFSARVIPFLLTNLALRNIEGVVYHGDSLTLKYNAIYYLSKGDNFSKVHIIEKSDSKLHGGVIMNPPYSQPWTPISDERFSEYELAPKGKADYAFLLHGLSLLSESSKMAIILPHGVLFRGQAEGKIRTKLLQDNLIDAIIGIPANMFMNTSIPTCILVLDKNKKSNDVLFIDASDKCYKEGKFNKFTEKHLKEIFDAYKERKEIAKFSFVASFKNIEDNDFNLNIPRYVDKYDEPEPIDIVKVADDLFKCIEDTENTMKEIGTALNNLVASTPETDEQLKTLQDKFNKYNKVTKKRKAEQQTLW